MPSSRLLSVAPRYDFEKDGVWLWRFFIRNEWLWRISTWQPFYRRGITMSWKARLAYEHQLSEDNARYAEASTLRAEYRRGWNESGESFLKMLAGLGKEEG